MDSYFGLKQRSEVKNVLNLDLFQLLSSQDINWWTGVVWITCELLWCFYQLFGLSFWRHPFTAEHPLLRQWWKFKKQLKFSFLRELFLFSISLKSPWNGVHNPITPIDESLTIKPGICIKNKVNNVDFTLTLTMHGLPKHVATMLQRLMMQYLLQ